MASKQVNIKKITRGNDVTLKFNISTTVDLASARFIVKKRIKDDDVEAILNKPISATLTANGQITDAGGADDLANCQVFLTKADTLLLKAGVEYLYDFEVFDASTKATTPVGGTLLVEERIRTATG